VRGRETDRETERERERERERGRDQECKEPIVQAKALVPEEETANQVAL
jgi:hypothetical protein